MRLIVMFVAMMAAAGCGEPGESEMVDAAPSELDGAWLVVWTCESGCGVTPGRPSLTYSSLLDVAGQALRWHDDDCPECKAGHDGVRIGECVVVGAAPDGVLDRDAYQLCAAAGELAAEVTWRSPFSGDASRWTASGVR